MINNLSLYRLSIIIIFAVVFPLIQNQWQNLYLFDKTNFTFYQIIYYLSGLVFPLIVYFNSLNIFTFYKFNSEEKNKLLTINGKILLGLVFTLLAFLSKIAYSYFLLSIDFLQQIVFKNNTNLNFGNYKEILFMSIISILLIIKKTNIIFKKFILLNFIICSLFIWHLEINSSLIEKKLLINNILDVNNLNIINILFIVLLEILFYLWSFLSFRTNLSDWSVTVVKPLVLKEVYKILMFYLFILIYYLILWQ